ncbi:hypothetical protein ACSBR2_021514 [Camellia fascicularis]
MTEKRKEGRPKKFRKKTHTKRRRFDPPQKTAAEDPDSYHPCSTGIFVFHINKLLKWPVSLGLVFQLLTISVLIFFFLAITTPSSTAAREEEDEHGFVRRIDRSKLMGLKKKEKLSHFRFFWHDIVSGSNLTAVQVVPPASNTSATFFGLLRMIDNPLTLGPKMRSSKMVGKARVLCFGVATRFRIVDGDEFCIE